MAQLTFRKMKVHIDEFGHIVSEAECKYNVTLTGSVTPCRSGIGYWYEIEKHPPPPIPIAYVFSYELLKFTKNPYLCNG